MVIRTVLFDLDGVVRHFFPERVAAIENRYHLPLGSIEAFAFSHPLIDEVTAGRMNRSEWIAAIGDHLSSPAAAAAWDAQPYRTDPDVLDLARELRTLGLTTAILTNGTDTIPAEADLIGLPGFFDAIFNSASIGYTKPDERAFQHVLDVLGMHGPNVFFTDDSPAKLTGATALGMITNRCTDVAALRASLREHRVSVHA